MAPAKKPLKPAALPKLDWTEKLVQTGKNASNDATQRRLKSLHEKLKGFEQDTVDVRSLDGVKKELLNNILMLNKDKGVKAYTACCQADLLRLYAPDAPFTDTELKDIFSFMAIQLRTNLKPHSSALAAPPTAGGKSNGLGVGGRITDVAFFAEYSYLLSSLAEIRSICLVPDLPGGDELVVDWFDAMFMCLRPDMSKAMLSNIEGVLTALIEESDTVPEEVVKKLLGQLTDFQERPEQPGFSVAANVIKATAHKLQRYILTYFSEIQIQHARDPTPEDIKVLTASHDLLVLLFTHAPGSLLNTLPQLSEALLSDEVQLRSVTTTTLGRMFASSAAYQAVAAGFGGVQGFQSYWMAWLGRRADKAPQVRLAWVESARAVLESRIELSSSLETAVQEKLEDVDERVRVACCKLFAELDYEIVLRNIHVPSLKALRSRLLDKKTSVAEQAYESLGTLYGLAYAEIAGGDELAISQFAWIPEAICRSLYDMPSREQRALADQVAAKYIIPLPADTNDEVAWVDRLITVAKHMEPRAFDAFMMLSNLVEPNVRPYDFYIETCEQYNGGVAVENLKEAKRSLEDIINFLTRHLANTATAKQHLFDFANANEKRLYSLFHKNADDKTELKTMIKNQHEIVRRIKQSQPAILPTFQEFSRKASRWVINRSSIATLLARSARPELDSAGIAARNILHFTAKHSPGLFRFHVAELHKALLNEKTPQLVQVAMHALAQLAQLDPQAMREEKKVIDRVLSLVVGKDVKGSKFAARYLACSKQYCGEGIEIILGTFTNDMEHSPLACLRAAAEFAVAAPVRFREKASRMLQLSLEEVIVRQSPLQEDHRRWTEEPDLDVAERAKILAVRLCIAHCLSVVGTENAGAAAQPFIKMLKGILANEGKSTEESSEPETLAAHLRLTSALGLMKLARFAMYEDMIDEDTFEAVVLVVQDTIFQVRYAFLKKYCKYMKQARYTSRWAIIPFFTAHDPEEQCIDITRQLFRELQAPVRSSTSKERGERPFVRFLLVLSRHPDFADKEPEDFVDMSKYLRLYIEHVVTAENIDMLYHVSQRLMTVRDARDVESDAIYMISELAQLMLQEYASGRGWTISDYRGHIGLQPELFRKLSSAAEATRIRKKSYLPEGMAEMLADASHKPRMKRVPKSAPARKTAPQKRTATPTAKRPAKRARKSAQVEEEDDESAEDDNDPDEDEDEEEVPEVPEDDMVVDDLESSNGSDLAEVLGRGGRRAAKVKRRKPVKATSGPNPAKRAGPAEESGSDLTDIEE